MKPIIGNPLTFEVSKGENANIQIIKKQLLTELGYFVEFEYENLMQETETFLLPNLIAEQLQRKKIDIVQNLAFSDVHYKEQCFYIDSNGHPAITEDKQLFYSYVYAFNMLEDIEYGLRTAKGILKVSLIDRLVKYHLDQVDHYFSENKNIEPFRNKTYLDNTKIYIDSHIVEPYTDISYLFQRLKIESFIEPVKHLDFAKWLKLNNFISEKPYKDIEIRGGFKSINKCSTPQRENNFNQVFNL